MLRFRRSLLAIVALAASSCVAHATHWQAEPHHVSVLPSGTFESDERAASIGLDYEYRISGAVGLGGIAEYAFREIDATTLLAVADLHLTDQFIVQTGPGVEFVDHEAELVYRVGVLYEWMEGRYTISPQLHYDWTSGRNALVFGLAFGVAF